MAQRRSARPARPLLAVATLLAAAWFVVVAPAAWAPIVLTPGEGPAGTAVTVAITGTDLTNCRVLFDNVQVASSPTCPASLTFTVPSGTAAGGHGVAVVAGGTGTATAVVGTATFTVPVPPMTTVAQPTTTTEATTSTVPVATTVVATTVAVTQPVPTVTTVAVTSSTATPTTAPVPATTTAAADDGGGSPALVIAAVVALAALVLAVGVAARRSATARHAPRTPNGKRGWYRTQRTVTPSPGAPTVGTPADPRSFRLLADENPSAPTRPNGKRGWYRTQRAQPVRGIVVHVSTADGSAAEVATRLAESAVAASAHAVVDDDGPLDLLPDDYVALHRPETDEGSLVVVLAGLGDESLAHLARWCEPRTSAHGLPVRRITVEDWAAGERGFLVEGGPDFPWDRFCSVLAQASSPSA